jgi:hypothetical protein
MSVHNVDGDGARPPGRRSHRLLRSKRTWGALIGAATLLSIAIPAASFADNNSGCDFAATGTTQSCSQPLAGSTFAGGDGNLLASPTTFGTTDWQNVAGLNPGFDKPSGTGDNSFGQGTKEDNANVTVVSGSIPPNKSDLTRFYEASEVGSNNHNFLYLAWERSNVLGSANMDFEINQKTQPDLTTSGAKTLNRTAGDLLVTYDFTNGGGRPTLGLLFWLTAAAGNTASQCFSSNSLPCWGNQETLNGSDSIGAVNNLDPVTDPLFPNSPNYINPVPALQFGETAIDLTAAGVFPSGTCKAFGSAFIKSRASASFGAEVKDFIAPTAVNISNCGEIKIIKHTDPRGTDKVFNYTSGSATTLPLPAKADAGGVTCAGNSGAGIQSDGSFCLNDKGNSTSDSTGNTVDTGGTLPAGTYTVTETVPTGWQLESLTCTNTGGSASGDKTTGTATITVAPDSTATCTYTNQQQLGAIKITKTGKDKNCTGAGTPTITNGTCTGAGTANLKGATFTIKDSSGTEVTGSPATTGDNGTVCVGSLPFSGTGTDYSVQETTPPSGYSADNTAAVTVTVTKNSTCGDGNEATTSFSDTPLTNISASATSVVPGATNSKVTCVDSSNANIGNSPQGFKDPAEVDANGLKPGTYTCTIVIDP